MSGGKGKAKHPAPFRISVFSRRVAGVQRRRPREAPVAPVDGLERAKDGDIPQVGPVAPRERLVAHAVGEPLLDASVQRRALVRDRVLLLDLTLRAAAGRSGECRLRGNHGDATRLEGAPRETREPRRSEAAQGPSRG
eukprot:6512495-Prymnesium_polylepis.1